jgi:hypothetical protein
MFCGKLGLIRDGDKKFPFPGPNMRTQASDTLEKTDGTKRNTIAL